MTRSSVARPALRAVVQEMRTQADDWARHAESADAAGRRRAAGTLATASETTARWADRLAQVLGPVGGEG